MAQSDVILPTERLHELPAVRTITLADLRDALTKGLDDFWAMPTHVIFLSLIYPIVGIALAGATFDYDVLPLLFPLAAGFALIGPFAAIGLYELSRRRELGLDTSWRHAFDVANFGSDAPTTPATFARNVLTTPAGQRLIIIGNAVGFLFAVVAFVLSVVSFPLLLDRHTGVAVAIITSIRAVLANPLPMAAWALFVTGALVIGSLPFLIGLALVMAVLGHSTWHLYRKVVEPDTSPRPEFHPRPKGRRYGADLPVSLFVPSKPDDRA